MWSKTHTPFTDESRIRAEGQKDGEKNIPEMGAYSPSQFEQALIARGEQAVQGIYKKASLRIARLQSIFEALHRRFKGLKFRAPGLSRSHQSPEAGLGPG